MFFYKPFDELLSTVYFVAQGLLLYCSCTELAFYCNCILHRKGHEDCTAQEEHLLTHIELFREQKVSVNIPLIGLMKTHAKHNHKLYHNKPLNMDYGETTLRFFLSRSLWCLILGCSVSESESSHTHSCN